MAKSKITYEPHRNIKSGTLVKYKDNDIVGVVISIQLNKTSCRVIILHSTDKDYQIGTHLDINLLWVDIFDGEVIISNES
jgi:hypothetical protein